MIAKRLPDAPHETLLVLDGTIGQNAVQQAKMFAAAVPITGLVVTKLDGTARGGVVVAVHEALDVPVKFIGVGEAADDLVPFDAREFAPELLGERLKPPTRPRQHAPPARHAGHLPEGGRARRAPRRSRRLGVVTAGDLLYHIPHRYEDASTVAPDRLARAGDAGHRRSGASSPRACCPRERGCASSRRCSRTTAG